MRKPSAGEPFSKICRHVSIDSDEHALMMGEQEIDESLCLNVVSRNHRADDQASAKLTNRREGLNSVFFANDSEFRALAQNPH